MRHNLEDPEDEHSLALALVLGRAPKQYRTASHAKQKKEKVSLLDIPVELLFKVLANLSRQEVFQLRLVSRIIDNIAFSYQYWKECCFESPWRVIQSRRVCYRTRLQPTDAVLKRVFNSCGRAIGKVKLHSIEDKSLMEAMFSSKAGNLKKIHLAGISSAALDKLFGVLSSPNLSSMPNVTELHLIASKASSFYPTDGLACIPNVFPALTALHLMLNAPLEPNDIAAVTTSLLTLTSLSLANCDKLDIASFSSSQPFPRNLQYLVLSQLRNLRDDDIAQLASQLPELRILGFHGARHITDEGIAHLTTHNKLEWIKVMGCMALSLGVFDPFLQHFEPALGCPIVHSCIGKAGLGMAIKRRAEDNEAV